MANLLLFLEESNPTRSVFAWESTMSCVLSQIFSIFIESGYEHVSKIVREAIAFLLESDEKELFSQS